jgi:hypothetical protein
MLGPREVCMDIAKRKLQEDEENDIMRNIIVFSASNDEVKGEIKEA